MDGKELHATRLGTEQPIRTDDLEKFKASLQTVLDAPPGQAFSVHLGLAVDQK
jgi:hypothetical protein